MQGNYRVDTMHLGTLAANAQGVVPIVQQSTLISVSLVGSNANNATIDCGTVANNDGILDGKAAGVSNVPATYKPADWNGADAVAGRPVTFAAGTHLMWTIDYDGAGGTAIQNATLQFVFMQ